MSDLLRAAELIRNADALLIGAGAGMGVDSGRSYFAALSLSKTRRRIRVHKQRRWSVSRAAFPVDRVYEIHGSIHAWQWMVCDEPVWSSSSFVPEFDVASCRLLNSPPLRPSCGSVARPNILMFGDWGWDGSVSDTQESAMSSWLWAHGSGAGVIELGAGITYRRCAGAACNLVSC